MAASWRQLGRWLQVGSLYILLFLLPISKAAIEITFFLLLAGWLAEYVFGGAWRTSVWLRPSLRPIAVALLVYLGWCVLSIPLSTYVSLSVNGFVRKTLEYALFFVLAADAARHVSPSRMVVVILSSAAVVSVDAVLQEVIGFDPLLHHVPTVYGRMTGPYENPGDLAVYLMVTLLLGIALLRHPQARGRRRAALWALLVLEALCLVRTECQSAWMAVAIGLGLLALLHRPLRRSLLIIGGLCGVAAVALLAVKGRLIQVLTLTDVGVGDRLIIWQAGWKMVQARPFTGLGLNTFMANYLQYRVGGEAQPRYAHNGYLQTAAELGIVGLVSLLVLLGLIFHRLLRSLKRVGPRLQTPLLGLTVGLLAFALQASLDTNFYALRQVALFWVWMGLALGFSEDVASDSTSKAVVSTT